MVVIEVKRVVEEVRIRREDENDRSHRRKDQAVARRGVAEHGGRLLNDSWQTLLRRARPGVTMERSREASAPASAARHRQECLCHIFRRYCGSVGVFAGSNVAQTLLSVPGGEAAPSPVEARDYGFAHEAPRMIQCPTKTAGARRRRPGGTGTRNQLFFSTTYTKSLFLLPDTVNDPSACETTASGSEPAP